jgi:hypothetical protein
MTSNLATPQRLTVLLSPARAFHILHLAVLFPVELVPNKHRDEVGRRQGPTVRQPLAEIDEGLPSKRSQQTDAEWAWVKGGSTCDVMS